MNNVALSKEASLTVHFSGTDNKSSGKAEDFCLSQIHHFKAIVDKAFRDLSAINDAENSNAAAQEFGKIKDNLGIWYAQDFYTAMEKTKQQGLLNWLTDDNFSLFLDGYLPENIFTMPKPLTFKIRNKTAPSQALDFIGKGSLPSLLDCSSIYSVAFFHTLKDYIGVEKFDHLFAFDSPTPFHFSGDLGAIEIGGLFDVQTIKSSKEIQLGDKCYFSNIPGYYKKHPYGEARGYSVICANEGQKPFLGFGLSPEGASIRDVQTALFKAYNKPTIGSDDKNLKTHTIGWKEFQKSKGSSSSSQDGKLSLAVVRPNISRIQRLAEASLKDVREVFQSMKK